MHGYKLFRGCECKQQKIQATQRGYTPEQPEMEVEAPMNFDYARISTKD